MARVTLLPSAGKDDPIYAEPWTLTCVQRPLQPAPRAGNANADRAADVANASPPQEPAPDR